MRYKLVMFDLDGTILNTLEAIGIGVNKALKYFGLKEYAIEEYKNLVGGGLDKLAQKIIDIEKYNIDSEKLSAKIKEECSNNFDNGIKIYEEAYKFLDYLKENNILYGVLTNKEHSIAIKTQEKFLSKWNFCEFYGASIDYPLKPNPQKLNEIIAKYSLKKDEVLYVGDMQVDIDLAKNANVDVCYCMWGFGNMKGEIIDDVVKKIYSYKEVLQ